MTAKNSKTAPQKSGQKSYNARFGNQSAVKHNGETAISAIHNGTELTGPARQAELAVYEELASAGRASIVTRNAARLQAASDLFWNALIRAGEANDLEKIDRYAARFGWLSQAALRAWAQVGVEEKSNDDPNLIDALASIKDKK